MNDSIILTHDISKYFYYIDNVMDINTNLYGYNDSTQIKYHYQSYCFLLKTTIINKFILFFESKKSLIYDLTSLIYNIELKYTKKAINLASKYDKIESLNWWLTSGLELKYDHDLNMCEIDENHDCFLKIGKEYNISKNIFWENESLYEYLLSNNIFAIIKLKRIFDIVKDYKINIYGENMENFDYNFYRLEYEDMNNLDDSELLNHFITIGQYEGRRYNKICDYILPKYYRDKLNSINLLYFFDIPDTFDIYFYKKKYNDVYKLSNIQIINHYINYGFYEGRIYDFNIYLNNYYINIIYNLNCIKYELSNDFNIYAYLLLNKNIKDIGYLSVVRHHINTHLLYTKKQLDKILFNFNYYNYIKINKIKNISIINVIKNYINNDDKRKKYIIPYDFNHDIYKKINKDLSKMNNNDLEIHYLKYGIYEKRLYKLYT